MNHYPHHLGDYAKDTTGLSMIEHGAYRLILDAYYASEKAPLADEVYAIAKAGTPVERKAMIKVLRKFELRDGRYYHKRVEEELAAYRERAETARTNGKKGGKRPAEHNPPGNPAGYPSGYPDDHQPGNPLGHQSGGPSGNLASSQEPEYKKRFPDLNITPAPVDNPGPEGRKSTPRATTRTPRTDASLIAEGKRKGIEARVGESMEAYESRVRTARA